MDDGEWIEEARGQPSTPAASRPLLIKQVSSCYNSSPDHFGDSSLLASFTSQARASVTPILMFSTFVAVCGSFCYGCALGYSSPAETGITEDWGLSVAECLEDGESGMQKLCMDGSPHANAFH